MEKRRRGRGEMGDTGLNLAHDKKYNQYTTEDIKCPEGDATRGKKGEDGGRLKEENKYRKCG